ncbi:hypothetical protein CKO11_15945 [Rhodobacter sp. TJ_12]|uniref:glycosyltransferase family 2 protein n=1 Tax=Rhodobacter sp. TJ_12 TaxID=2029399 RepID=UPI001CBDC048|nr:glycosyltransferase family 2 protein [Rhodobacter sp. TJ_12]MBZ4023943.1 hypothetical protein [Rhodobacter sp. TJ_12]
MASWAIVAMVDEPAALLAAWAGHHLDLGASEVHLCLDRPQEEAFDLLDGTPCVHLHLDGADDWAFRGIGARPVGMNARQKYHASRILAQTRAEWLLHCDSDEFLWPEAPGTEVGALLDQVPQKINWLQVGVAERVHLRKTPRPDIFAGAYRLPWPRYANEGYQVYDALTRELLNYGLAGHHMGKAMVRAGRDLFIGVHHGLTRYNGQRCPAVAPAPGLRVLHYDGLTLLHFALKMLRYGQEGRPDNPASHAPARWAQVRGFVDDVQADDLQRLVYRAAKTLGLNQTVALQERGLLRQFQPDVAARARAALGLSLDLRPAAFDRALICHEMALIGQLQARYGFDPKALAAS